MTMIGFKLFQAFKGNTVPFGLRLLFGAVSLAFALIIWFSSLHLFFEPNLADYISNGPVAPKTQEIAAYHLKLWEDPGLRAQTIDRMRTSNPEWDFMGRTYLVLALANMSLREPSEKERFLTIIDRIIDNTLEVEREKGIFHFLMGYSRDRSFVYQQAHSLFIDGEIALMLGARRLVEEKSKYRELLNRRVDLMLSQMQKNPVLSGESYPDECWMFCNTVALAAIKVFDILEGQDHSDFLIKWLATAKENLIDKKTGLLISSYTFDGDHLDGPEGSSIWMVSHCLQIIDEEFAKDQYRRAKKELARSLLGFAYAREWPVSWQGPQDIDSGPTIPILEANAGASGLAFLGASSFGDKKFLGGLLASLNLGAFPVKENGALKFSASNQVGDAVLLYSLVQGPLWREVKARTGQ